MIDQYLLRYFLAVAELGNFSRAAERVCVTQPTLSAGIAKLEAQLGVQLFDRDKRRVALTAAGSRFLFRARRIAKEFELAVQEVSHLPEPQLLRVGILATIPMLILEDVLAQHRRGNFQEALELLDGSELELIDRLERGRLDVALSVIRTGSARFRVEPLRSERYLMVLPPDHSRAEAEFVTAEEIAQDWMVVRRHCEALPEISRHFTQRGVRPRFILKTRSDERMLAIVRAGQGIGMMPESFRNPAVRFVRLADFEMKREIGLLYNEEGEISRYKSSPFMQLLRERFIQKQL
jgi:DNA-binding transcriptional LysR family regulator